MTHSSRLQWLAERGFLPEDRSISLPDIGTCLWIDGNKGHRPVSLWLAVRDGSTILHGITKGVMTWEELQEWVEPPVEEVKPVAVKERQRGLFDD